LCGGSQFPFAGQQFKDSHRLRLPLHP
jgi:hypothetical protein